MENLGQRNRRAFNFLTSRRRNGRVLLDDGVEQPTGHHDAQIVRRHVEQQRFGFALGKQIALNRSTTGYHFVGVHALRGLQAEVSPVVASIVAKLGVFPAAALVIIYLLNPDQLTAEVAILFAALPTGVAAYTLAREMGGNSSMMATIITVQTLISFLTLPLSILLARMLLF